MSSRILVVFIVVVIAALTTDAQRINSGHIRARIRPQTPDNSDDMMVEKAKVCSVLF